MDARERVREALGRGRADRPPFLAVATEYTANLAQTDVESLYGDPNLFVASFLDSIAACRFDAVLWEVPIDWVLQSAVGSGPAAGKELSALREDIARLRGTVRGGAGLIPLLPGPVSLCERAGAIPSIDAMDDLVAGLLHVFEFLDPPALDAAAVIERVPLTADALIDLGEALTALWNVARYYAMPSLMIAADAPAALARIGARSVSAWSGAAPEELQGSGVAIGVPVSNPERLPPLPAGAFYITRGEIPPAWPVTSIRRIIAAPLRSENG